VNWFHQYAAPTKTPHPAQSLLGNIKWVVTTAWKWILRVLQRNTYTRTIEFQQRHNKYGYRIHEADADDRNQILQKAITLFISSKEKDLDMWSGDIALSKPITTKKSNDSSDDEDESGEAADQLKKYKVMTVPPKGQWVDIGNSLWFWEEREVAQTGKDSQGETAVKHTIITVRMRLQANTADAEERVEKFLKEAFDFYVAKIEANEDQHRYMYNPLANSGDGPIQASRLQSHKSI
jgi:hypothetical protein